MNMRIARRGAVAAALLACALQGAQAGSDPAGQWLVEDASAVVQIDHCGAALCGKILWSRKPVDAKGQPLCGRAVLCNALPGNAGSWDKGWVYSPKTGSQYPVTLSLSGDGSLHLHITASLFGRDQTWTRPKGAVTPCSP